MIYIKIIINPPIIVKNKIKGNHEVNVQFICKVIVKVNIIKINIKVKGWIFFILEANVIRQIRKIFKINGVNRINLLSGLIIKYQEIV